LKVGVCATRNRRTHKKTTQNFCETVRPNDINPTKQQDLPTKIVPGMDSGGGGGKTAKVLGHEGGKKAILTEKEKIPPQGATKPGLGKI